MLNTQGPIGKLAQGVTSGIGFVAEAHGYRKAKKAAIKQREEEDDQQQKENTEKSPSQSPNARIPSPDEENTADARVDEMERTWQLDEAQDVIIEETKPRKSKEGTANPDKVIAAFLQRQPPPSTPPAARLALPVAIPQRRPKDKTRGFVRAYAPDMENVGISPDAWLDFIDTLCEASLANPWINALNLVSLAASPLPTLTSQLISAAITIATTVAIETQGRYRQNKAIDRLNDEWFRPRGLFCLVMTWDATSFNDKTNASITTTIQNNIDSQGRMSHKFQSSNGVTNGMESLQTADLIFPGLDFIATATQDQQKGFKAKWKRGMGFVDDYMDRRAQAKFIAENPDSYLNQGAAPKFLSKYADPTYSIIPGGQQNGSTGGGVGGGLLGGGRSGGGILGDRGSGGGILGGRGSGGLLGGRGSGGLLGDRGSGGLLGGRGSGGLLGGRASQGGAYGGRGSEEDYYRGRGSQGGLFADRGSQGGLLGRGLGGRAGGGGLFGLVGLASQSMSGQSRTNSTGRASPAPYPEAERYQSHPSVPDNVSGERGQPYQQGYQPYQQSNQQGDQRYQQYDQRYEQYDQRYPQTDPRYPQQYDQQYQQDSRYSHQYDQQDPRYSQQYNQQYQQDPRYQQQQQQQSVGLGSMKKLFASKALYLMVVNMPTEEEMAQAKSLAADWDIRSQQEELHL